MNSSPTIKMIRNEVSGIANRLTLHNFNVEIIPFSSIGFASGAFKVLLKGKIKNSEKYEKTYFAKVSGEKELFQKVFDSQSRFQCEIFAYTEVIPRLKSIQDEIRAKEFVKVSFLEFYGGSFVQNEEFILLECLDDYGSVPVVIFASYDSEIKSAVETMGKFHALSFVMKHRNPKYFMELGDLVRKVSPIRNDYWRRGCEFAYNFTINLLDREDHSKRLQEMLATLEPSYRLAFDKSEYKVICHGDCHILNFLFKLKEGQRIVSDIKVLDFQLLDFASPAVDLSNFLGPHSSPEGYAHLLDVHYHAMQTTLQQFGLDVRHIYPRSEYNKDLVRAAIVETTVSCICFVLSALSGDFSSERNALMDLFTGNLNSGDLLEGVELENKAVTMREKLREQFERRQRLL